MLSLIVFHMCALLLSVCVCVFFRMCASLSNLVFAFTRSAAAGALAPAAHPVAAQPGDAQLHAAIGILGAAAHSGEHPDALSKKLAHADLNAINLMMSTQAEFDAYLPSVGAFPGPALAVSHTNQPRHHFVAIDITLNTEGSAHSLKHSEGATAKSAGAINICDLLGTGHLGKSPAAPVALKAHNYLCVDGTATKPSALSKGAASALAGWPAAAA